MRLDLPSQHHSAREASEHCLVLVEKDAEEALVIGPLDRAKERGVLAASQDWVKHCLLQQLVLPPQEFPPKLKHS